MEPRPSAPSLARALRAGKGDDAGGLAKPDPRRPLAWRGQGRNVCPKGSAVGGWAQSAFSRCLASVSSY
ncbi:hypothetical protein C6568_03115 [Melaminivora suipulveris]|uniref:Uncharacterized protein n=1 Tax=Melaminivora suipulveris TaxID=2109913 RepID=A0A2R3Q990_9BURK|nr:hypothetical protein C6568_03115 [Melaminivora suipulveris]